MRDELGFLQHVEDQDLSVHVVLWVKSRSLVAKTRTLVVRVVQLQKAKNTAHRGEAREAYYVATSLIFRSAVRFTWTVCSPPSKYRATPCRRPARAVLPAAAGLT